MAVNLAEIAENIELRDDGLWHARTSSRVSYPEEGNENCFEVEEGSFWFRHRNDCLIQMFKVYPPPGTFFDIGGGNGYVARAVQDAGIEVVLVEPGPAGAQNARRRGIRQVVEATLEDARFRSGTLPAVGLFDVIEHVEDDRQCLRDLNRLLIPGGRAYITVPAFQQLWSYEDDHAGHWRRYTIRGLSELLRETGYQVEFATYVFGFLPLATLFIRVLPWKLGFAPKRVSKARMLAEHKPGNPLVTHVLRVLTRRELARLASGKANALGGSCLVVARKCE